MNAFLQLIYPWPAAQITYTLIARPYQVRVTDKLVYWGQSLKLKKKTSWLNFKYLIKLIVELDDKNKMAQIDMLYIYIYI